MFNKGKQAFEEFEEYICETISNGLKNTTYEDDIETFGNIFNNVFSTIEEMMINNMVITYNTYEDLIRQALLELGIV